MREVNDNTIVTLPARPGGTYMRAEIAVLVTTRVEHIGHRRPQSFELRLEAGRPEHRDQRPLLVRSEDGDRDWPRRPRTRWQRRPTA